MGNSMKVIIVGAGELGRLLAYTLCAENHDVVIVDSSLDGLERLTDKLDIMTVEGSCASVATLKSAGAESADVLLAVSGDEAANILSCQIASKLGVRHTLCRLYSSDAFSEKDGITPDSFGIWRTFSPPEECVRKILDVFDNEIILEKIRFSSPDALMAIFEITPSSLLAGLRIKDIPGSDLIATVRFAAILRSKQFLIPHGDTILVPGDKIYLAGHRDNVQAFIRWITPDSLPKRKRVIITGAGDAGKMLARKAASMGNDVVFIEKELKKGEELLDELPSGILLIHGDATDEETLEEAGISSCDIFVSAAQDDEENILSAIIAKRLGARKVVTLTYKPEYIKIVPALDLIDSGFSATLISVNTILRLLESGMMRIDAILQQFNAHLTEFRISERSPLCGKRLPEAGIPSSVVFALIFRGSQVITPSGHTVFHAGDTIVAIVTSESEKELKPLFPEK